MRTDHLREGRLAIPGGSSRAMTPAAAIAPAQAGAPVAGAQPIVAPASAGATGRGAEANAQERAMPC
jgi:hypothetical protein